MAVRLQSGGPSRAILARNPAYETDRNKWAEFLPFSIPFTRLTFDTDGSQIQSESIIGGNSDTLNILERIGAAGDWEQELLPPILPHIMMGVLNPDMPPTSEAVPDEEVLAADTSVAATISGDAFTGVTVAGENKDLDWPGRLAITLAGATVASEGGTIIVRGWRRTGRTLSVLEPAKSEIPVDDNGDFFTDKYFTRIRNVTFSGITSGTIGAIAQPDSFDTEIALNSNGHQFDGWTMAGRKGDMPFWASKVIPNTFELTVGATARILMGLLGQQYREDVLLTNPNIEALKIPDTIPGTSESFSQYFPTPDTAEFLGTIGTAVQIGDSDDAKVVRASNVRLLINNNLEPQPGFDGDLISGAPIIGGQIGRAHV